MLSHFLLCLVSCLATSQAFIYLDKSSHFRRNDVPLLSHSKNLRLAVVGGSLFLSTPSVAQDTDAGEKIFTANCAACHAGGKNAVVYDHTLEKAAIEKYLTGGFNEKAIVYQVTNGKNAMPAFSGRLSEQDISNVAAYVLRTAEEGWD
jgi:cytochrome c6